MGKLLKLLDMSPCCRSCIWCVTWALPLWLHRIPISALSDMSCLPLYSIEHPIVAHLCICHMDPFLLYSIEHPTFCICHMWPLPFCSLKIHMCLSVALALCRSLCLPCGSPLSPSRPCSRNHKAKTHKAKTFFSQPQGKTPQGKNLFLAAQGKTLLPLWVLVSLACKCAHVQHVHASLVTCSCQHREATAKGCSTYAQHM